MKEFHLKFLEAKDKGLENFKDDATTMSQGK